MDAIISRSADQPSAIWKRAALGWIFDSIKWVLLFGVLLPGVLAFFDPFGARYYVPILCLATMVVACTVIHRAQALSRTAGLLVCFGCIVLPLVQYSLLLSRKEILIYADYFAVAVAVFSLMPIGIIGLFWIFFWGTRSLSHGGMTAFIRGYPKTALGYFALAARRSATDREQALAFSAILSAKGHPQKAALVCDLLTLNDPDNVLFWRARASFEWLADNFEASYQASEAAMALEPQKAALYFERAVRRARHQKKTRGAALEDLRRAVELNTSNQEYRQLLVSLEECSPDSPTPSGLPGEDRLFSLSESSPRL